MVLNHVNLNKLKDLIEEIKKDPANGKIVPKITGEWIFEEGQPQFRSELQAEGGSFTVEADMPPKLGGWGSRPGPLQWCLYGLASCYCFTFAALAAMDGIVLNRLSIEAQSHVDFSKVFGLSENPIVEEVSFIVTVTSDTDSEKLEKIRELADDRCPAVYCLTKPVKLTTELLKT